VEIFGDSKLAVKQISGESQSLDGMLNEYREKCLDTLGRLEKFSVGHVPRGANSRANTLAQRPGMMFDEGSSRSGRNQHHALY
jgi:ribonuclease HI